MKFLIYKLLSKFKSRISIITFTALFWVTLLNILILLHKSEPNNLFSTYELRISVCIWFIIMPILIITTIFILLKLRKKIAIVYSKLSIKTNYHLWCSSCSTMLYFLILGYLPLTMVLIFNFNFITLYFSSFFYILLFAAIRFHHNDDFKNIITKIKKGI